MKRVLLLNSDYSPMHFISDMRAFSLVFKGRAEVLDMGGKPSVWSEEVRTSNTSFKIPATIRLLTRVNRKWMPPRFRKKAVFFRDDWRCQYCQADLHRSNMTIDHVQPKSRGGPSTWKNCVASCKSCNRKKANKTPYEAGMSLFKQPMEPTPIHFFEIVIGNTWHDDWSSFISSN